jgi:hypothetical protein
MLNLIKINNFVRFSDGSDGPHVWDPCCRMTLRLFEKELVESMCQRFPDNFKFVTVIAHKIIYPRTIWANLADHQWSAEQTLGTTVLCTKAWLGKRNCGRKCRLNIVIFVLVTSTLDVTSIHIRSATANPRWQIGENASANIEWENIGQYWK